VLAGVGLVLSLVLRLRSRCRCRISRQQMRDLGGLKRGLGLGVSGPGLMEVADWPKPIWLGHRAALTA